MGMQKQAKKCSERLIFFSANLILGRPWCPKDLKGGAIPPLRRKCAKSVKRQFIFIFLIFLVFMYGLFNTIYEGSEIIYESNIRKNF